VQGAVQGVLADAFQRITAMGKQVSLSRLHGSEQYWTIAIACRLKGTM
jgi:hypothetical protein